jgi:hypothetical protein
MPVTRVASRNTHDGRKPLTLDQARLNIEARSRTNHLPWRGQFSPELVEYIIQVVCPESRSFLDPFCGSGTVLFEAVQRGYVGFGVEANPAAWHLASLAEFVSLPPDEKTFVLRRLKKITSGLSFGSSALSRAKGNPEPFLKAVGVSTHSFLRKALASVLLLGMGDKADLAPIAIARAAFTVTGLLQGLLESTASAECFLADARRIPVEDNSIEAVITSPPYINVFNYHQNYRPATELLGWKPLEAARSEIGSNRKHRMNRFLTVVQYCMDIAQCLDELTRVMRQGAPLVIVLGRTSNVLGASFENGAIIERLLKLSGHFGSLQRAERVFTNRYGERIFEDILIGARGRAGKTDEAGARKIGVDALKQARALVPEQNRPALEEAIAEAGEVAPSPLLKISVPLPFQEKRDLLASQTHASH